VGHDEAVADGIAGETAAPALGGAGDVAVMGYTVEATVTENIPL